MNSSGSTLFEKYLGRGRIHPCILLVGPDKEIKWQAAMVLAKTVFCSSKRAGLFCGECSSCRRIEKQVFPDVLRFRENDEEDLKVENVREIIYQMEVAPLEGKGKVCCIEEAHRMNAASSNAFLKTLEEPKEGRYFVLTSSKPGSLLPTLISRSMVFHFKPQEASLVFSKEETDLWESLLLNLRKEKNTDSIVEHCEEKSVCLRFLLWIQSSLRNRVVLESEPSPFQHLSPMDCIYKYQLVVELERKLQSNANHGLLLESLMRKEFRA